MNANNQHNQQNSHTNMQPMTINQTVQVIQAEYSFFYKAHNDFQIYNITCKEIPFEVVSHLLSNHNFSTRVQPSNLHVFYY